jgi:hypothetical protein
MQTMAWHQCPTLGGLIRIVLEPGAGFIAYHYFPDFSLMSRQESSWGNTQGETEAWVRNRLEPQLTPLERLGDYVLYLDPHAPAEYPQIQMSPNERYTVPVRGCEVLAGTRVSRHAGNYFVVLHGRNAVDFEAPVPVLIQTSDGV